MVGQNGNEENVENSGGVFGVISDLNQSLISSVSDVYEQSVGQLKATPSFVRSLFSVPETRLIAKNIGIIAATDLLPIIAVNTAMVSLESYVREQYFDPSLVVDLGLMFAKSATYLITLRQTTQALTRIAIVQAKQSSVFDEATRTTRAQVDSEICCHNCTKSRFIKGNIRAPLVYIAQQSVIYALRKTLGGMGEVYNFDLVVDSYSSLVIGQLIMDYRLANDGLCERHQHEYSKQFWERILALGLPVVILRKLIAEVIGTYTGVDKNLYGSMIETFTSVAMVGLVHHMSFPRPVVESSRYLNPASFVRAGTAYVMDKVEKDLVAYGTKIFTGEGSPINYFLVYKNIKEKYHGPLMQVPLKIFLPYMYSDARNFVNDPVMRDYWPVLLRHCLNAINEVEILQKKVEYHKVSRYVSKDVQEAFKPLSDLLAPLYKEVIVIFERYMLNPLLALGLKQSPENIERLVAHLRSEVFKSLINELKGDLAYLNVDVNRQGFITGCMDSLSTFAYLNYAMPEKKFNLNDIELNEARFMPRGNVSQMAQMQEPVLRLEPESVINAVIAGIDNYNDFITNNVSATCNSLSALTSTTVTLFTGSDPRAYGKIRAAYYLRLLDAEQPLNYKLLVCFAILKNNSGSDLLHKVGKSLNAVLPERFQSREVDHTYTALRNRLMPMLMDLFYDSLPIDHHLIVKQQFLLQAQPYVDFIINQTNSGLNVRLIPQQVDDWYTNFDKFISRVALKEEEVINYGSSVIS